MKIVPVQFKIGSLMILAVIILSATGYLSYSNLSSIVSSIKVDLKPEIRLLSIREISMDLEKAQNSIRIYSITTDTLDLKPYYSVISDIDEKVSSLRTECLNDPILLEQTDTISKLIEENIVIWNKILYLNNNQKVIESLRQLSDKLNTDSENARKVEKNILKRVFSRNNKSRLNGAELISDLRKIEQQDSIIKKNLIRRESQLAVTGSEIKGRLYDIISRIENEILTLNEAKASSADKLAQKTYFWLALFSISGTLLAIVVMFIIIRFVRKTQLYQIALTNSKNETEKLARTKEMFMANMSHEIRTPVTAISGFTEQLLHEQFDENTTRSLKIIKSSSDHLKNIINDILDFSKLQNEKLILEKEHFRIRELLEDVYALFEKQAIRNNSILSFSLSPDTPSVFLGDPYRLKQIMINLVSNSVKFTQNGKVHFNVKSIKTNSAEIELILEFTDTGIGIEESKISYIFEDFTQEEMSTSRKFGGTGLGLPIVKKLAELHGGGVECISRKNHGTQITCRMPYLTGDEKQVKPDLEPPLYIPEKIRNLRILIVDDEEYNRLLFKAILDRWKVTFEVASSGSEALEMLKTKLFDVLFMDARMPGTDGLTTTKIIRNDLKISESAMPVICISAAILTEEWQKYTDAGMNTFMPKPFTEEMLLTTILSVIKEEKDSISGPSEISFENLYHISGGDEQFVKQMLISFADTTEKGLKEMMVALNSGQNRDVAELAHKMLPPCRHIGANELCDYLKRIEAGIKNKEEKRTIEELVKGSLTEFEQVNELVQEHISKIS
jgi:signal transduction histidine kinase/DNA-binding response OmpR family regulator